VGKYWVLIQFLPVFSMMSTLELIFALPSACIVTEAIVGLYLLDLLGIFGSGLGNQTCCI